MPALPSYITQVSANVFSIDPDIAYPAILGKLEQLGVKTGGTDQYWLEVVFQMAKVHAQNFIEDSGLDPRPGATLILKFDSSGGRKGRWALSTVVKGRGTIVATKGKEARALHASHGNAVRAALIAAN